MDPQLFIENMLQSKRLFINGVQTKVNYAHGTSLNIDGYIINEPIKEPINELENIMTPINKLDSQPGFIAATRRKGTFIVGSVDSSGVFSAAPHPMPHETASSARMECKRLATLYPGRLYIFLQLSGAELIPNAPVSI